MFKSLARPDRGSRVYWSKQGIGVDRPPFGDNWLSCMW